ncbi:MAG TPA: hypothetical protein VLS89_06030 [Candidatus Nanopelagicales bacterium]|nr:hypothetical protein [Candidatus Nanopelagicales bacterium]
MAVKNMDAFSLRDRVVDEYRSFATSFTSIFAEDIRQQVDAIYAEGRFWPEPLIQINPSYRRSKNISELVASGMVRQGPLQGARSRGGAREVRCGTFREGTKESPS